MLFLFLLFLSQPCSGTANHGTRHSDFRQHRLARAISITSTGIIRLPMHSTFATLSLIQPTSGMSIQEHKGGGGGGVSQVVHCSFFCQHKFLVLLISLVNTGDSVGHNADDAHYPKREELQQGTSGRAWTSRVSLLNANIYGCH